jgi:hypothetical protein
MTPTRLPERQRSASSGAFTGVIVGLCLWSACFVSTSVGAVGKDGGSPADRSPNPDQSAEPSSPSDANDSPELTDASRPCNSFSQGCEAAGDFCDTFAMSCTGGEGVCRHVPENCPEPTPPAAVCGCDNVTYGNNCLRLAAGVWLQYQGACK